jgi:CRISPR-associated protein Cas5 subtype I-A
MLGNQEISASKAEDQYIKEMAMVLEHQNHPVNEVPQQFWADPQAFLPLNSEKLMGATNMLEKLSADANTFIQGEINQIQKLHKKTAFWEDKISKNKTLMEKNRASIQKSTIDIVYDRKNRDYWWERSELVTLDYQNAEAAGRSEDWGWLIKKWGLKNADGSAIDVKNPSVEELCNGEVSNLSGEYRSAGNRYERSKKEKEAESYRLIRENSKYLEANETLQRYISMTYVNEIEPCQEGVLLLKELIMKFQALEQKDELATYGELRGWAETFLNDFLKVNSRVHLSIVSEFRKLASIPLPAENC